MIFRTRYEPLGSHVHVRVFVAARQGTTFAGIGRLTMSEADWAAFREVFRAEHLPEADFDPTLSMEDKP